jgi:hypothetical protein
MVQIYFGFGQILILRVQDTGTNKLRIRPDQAAGLSFSLLTFLWLSLSVPFAPFPPPPPPMGRRACCSTLRFTEYSPLKKLSNNAGWLSFLFTQTK